MNNNITFRKLKKFGSASTKGCINIQNKRGHSQSKRRFLLIQRNYWCSPSAKPFFWGLQRRALWYVLAKTVCSRVSHKKGYINYLLLSKFTFEKDRVRFVWPFAYKGSKPSWLWHRCDASVLTELPEWHHFSFRIKVRKWKPEESNTTLRIWVPADSEDWLGDSWAHSMVLFLSGQH